MIRELDLDRPVLVGWSYGGFAIADYVRAHGDDEIGGIVTVGSTSTLGTDEASELVDQRFLEEVGDVPVLEAPQRFDAALAEFVREVRARR